MGKIVGLLSGVLAGTVIVMVLLRWTREDRGRKCRFDERQELVRGRGFRYGFFTVTLSNIILAELQTVGERPFMDAEAAAFLSMLLGVLVHIGYCIWHEGYFALNENPGRMMVVFALLAVFNFAIFMVQLSHGEIIKNGVMTASAVNLWCAVEFLIIFVILFAKKLHDREEAE